jgi:hypothetical protein
MKVFLVDDSTIVLENSEGIVMCDVDGLKLVNDALGHQSGDEFLLTVSIILRSSILQYLAKAGVEKGQRRNINYINIIRDYEAGSQA